MKSSEYLEIRMLLSHNLLVPGSVACSHKVFFLSNNSLLFCVHIFFFTSFFSFFSLRYRQKSRKEHQTRTWWVPRVQPHLRLLSTCRTAYHHASSTDSCHHCPTTTSTNCTAVPIHVIDPPCTPHVHLCFN